MQHTVLRPLHICVYPGKDLVGPQGNDPAPMILGIMALGHPR